MSHIYFIGSEEARVVKIGVTRGSLRGRLQGIQTGCHFPIELLAYFPGDIEDERKLHQTFAPLALHGEWFKLDGKLESLVWYLDAGPEGATRDTFESAIWDCIVTGLHYPYDPMTEDEFNATANPTVWPEWAEAAAA